MKRLLAIAAVLCAAPAALGRDTRPQQPAHPAVVRVIAPERGGASYGSGALVGVNGMHGLVVTNWHVVRDAGGPIMVVFPDGFRSAAAVLKTDRDWDLAALAVWRPDVQPIPLATEAPRPGEVLTIAGYGRGWYRAAAGRCTQYVSPGRNLPFEMVELATPAREGDSGGPILNSRGELAGVLFGAGFGRTMGSYCGRVRWFLASVADDFQRLPSSPTMIARRPRPDPGQIATTDASPLPPPASYGRDASGLRDQRPARRGLVELRPPRPREPPAAEVSAAAETPALPKPAAPTRAQQIKTILAGIGVLALLFHGLRLLGAAAGS